MVDRLTEQLLERIEGAVELYHRLLLLVAPSGTGKTPVLAAVSQRTGAPVTNVNLEVSRRLLDLTAKQRALQLPTVLEDVVGRTGALVILDNIEVLFDVSLEQDPLRLLQGLSRNRTVVASWNGTVENGRLSYATPEHPEYRGYPSQDLVIITPEAGA